MARVKVAGGTNAVGRKRGAVAPKPLGYTFPNMILPPPGSFDPGLQAQIEQSQRGLLDQIADTGREKHRDVVDVKQRERELKRGRNQNLSDIARQRNYALADAAYSRQQLGIDFARNIADLALARQRGEEDYQKVLTDLQNTYQTRAVQQTQSAIQQQGSVERGTDAASSAVRAANQAYDKSGIDQSQERRRADWNLAEGRLNEDYGIAGGRLEEELARALTGYGIQGQRTRQDFRTDFNALGRAAQRAEQDRLTKLSRAKREQAFYQVDVGKQAYYAAHQNDPSIIFPGGAGGAATPQAGGPRGYQPPPSTNGGIQAPGTRATPPRAAIGTGRAISPLNASARRRPLIRY